MNIHGIMSSLAKHRPIFHSEADFKHALAWEIQTSYAQDKPQIRLEYFCRPIGKVDIWAKIRGQTYAIELKYKKVAYEGTIEGEYYLHTKDGAHPQVRYDVFRDFGRVEQACEFGADCGYALFLTNDPVYRNNTPNGASSPFSLQENRVVAAGSYFWPKGCDKFIKDRPNTISIRKPTPLQWHPYAKIDKMLIGYDYLLHSYQAGEK